MSTDDDFTAYVGTHWSSLVRTALLLGCDAGRAEPAVAEALVASYPRWARVWDDDRADEEVLTRLLAGIYGPTARAWRGENAEPGQPSPAEDDALDEGDEGALVRTLAPLLPLHRDVLVLRHVAELDDLQAADVLDVPPGTVHGRRDRALATAHPAGDGPLSEQRLTALVEQHRQEQPMSLPPADLLRVARTERRRRRRRASAVSAGVLAGLVVLSGAVRLVTSLADGSPAAAAPTAPAPTAPAPAPPWARHPSGPTPPSRLVGLNGWALRVPSSWGTDQVACDGVTPARPTVLFTRLLTPGPHCATGHPTLFVRIGDQKELHGVPWRTISGIPVLRRLHACAVCATLRVPSAGVSFQIRAANGAQLHRIAHSLVPLSPRQVNLPIGSSHDRGARNRMVTVVTAAGLRPRVLEVPSRRPPGTFLRSDPPIGTPVNLGRSVSLAFSAGDLGRYATPAALNRHGWRVSGVAAARPTYPRRAADHAAIGPSATLATTPTFLRTLTVIHGGPRHVVVRRRVVWLVVTPNPSTTHPGAATITAVDARTDHVIETQHAFRGRVRMAIR